VRQPARHAGDGEQHGEHLGGEALQVMSKRPYNRW
jgi:hypothetical protein